LPADHPIDLSVIVVTWNTRAMTIACLHSLLAETCSHSFEVIVVDNGSADGSAAAIAAEFPDITVLAEPVNHGFAVANNLAAQRARGRRLLLLNSDTVVLDRAVDRLLDFAELFPAAGIWGGRTVFADGSLNIGSCWGRQTVWAVACFAFGLGALFARSALFNPEAMGGWQRDSVREVDIISGCFLLIDADLWRRLDGFAPEFFMYGEEADLCARAHALGARPTFTPTATIIHHGDGSAAQRSDIRVLLLQSKIALARRSDGARRARLIAWLYLAAVAIRTLAYGMAAHLLPRHRDAAALWRDTWRRRAEWFMPLAAEP
jgi:GT2 family glycosyltransferase